MARYDDSGLRSEQDCTWVFHKLCITNQVFTLQSRPNCFKELSGLQTYKLTESTRKSPWDYRVSYMFPFYPQYTLLSLAVRATLQEKL